jgi:hypothetical protein
MEFLDQAAHHAWTNSWVSTLHTKAIPLYMHHEETGEHGTKLQACHAHLKVDAMHVTDAATMHRGSWNESGSNLFFFLSLIVWCFGTNPDARSCHGGCWIFRRETSIRMMKASRFSRCGPRIPLFSSFMHAQPVNLV